LVKIALKFFPRWMSATTEPVQHFYEATVFLLQNGRVDPAKINVFSFFFIRVCIEFHVKST